MEENTHVYEGITRPNIPARLIIVENYNPVIRDRTVKAFILNGQEIGLDEARARFRTVEVGPGFWGSPSCESGSLASGGTRTHCTCDTCF